MTRHTLYKAPNISAPPGPNSAAPIHATRHNDLPLTKAPLIDSYGRGVHYLRLSVTDRCDLRCTYCMSEVMEFLPKKELLSLEELDRLASIFIARGVRKLRLTGGEPLVRRGIVGLIKRLSRHLKSGALHELTLTTNGTQLSKYATELYAAGMRRINVSVDSFDPDVFARITRGGDLAGVMAGIKSAQKAGLRVKINTVALARDNVPDIASMIRFVHSQNMDMTLIEAMPLGEVSEDRFDQYVSLRALTQMLTPVLGLMPIQDTTGGPARYYQSQETGGRLGFITPLSHNFCESCNRVRLTCTGQLYMCLGQEGRVDLREILRASPDVDGALNAALDRAMRVKAKGHDFVIDRAGQAPALSRHMSVTGG